METQTLIDYIKQDIRITRPISPNVFALTVGMQKRWIREAEKICEHTDINRKQKVVNYLLSLVKGHSVVIDSRGIAQIYKDLSEL